MSCRVGRRCSLDPSLLWLWLSLAVAVLLLPLAWELPYATGEALERHTHTHTHTHRYFCPFVFELCVTTVMKPALTALRRLSLPFPRLQKENPYRVNIYEIPGPI